jgi:hypothetical protein
LSHPKRKYPLAFARESLGPWWTASHQHSTLHCVRVVPAAAWHRAPLTRKRTRRTKGSNNSCSLAPPKYHLPAPDQIENLIFTDRQKKEPPIATVPNLQKQISLFRSCALCVQGSAQKQDVAEPPCRPPSPPSPKCTQRERRTRAKTCGNNNNVAVATGGRGVTGTRTRILLVRLFCSRFLRGTRSRA